MNVEVMYIGAIMCPVKHLQTDICEFTHGYGIQMEPEEAHLRERWFVRIAGKTNHHIVSES